MNRKLLLKALSAALVCMTACAASAGNVTDVLGRMKTDLLAKPLPPEQTMRQYITSIRGDGSWPDIDYEGQNHSNWEAAPHIIRMRLLAFAWAGPGSLHHDGAAGRAVRLAAEYWCRNRFRSANWWWNEIMVPENMADAMIAAPELFRAPETRKTALAVVRQAQFGRTGQNRVWQAGIVLKRALLENDAPTARKTVDEITSELKLSDEEGIRADGSFHQHGPQLQFGNYGLGFLEKMSSWNRLLAGTPFAFDEARLNHLRHLVFNGYRWILWKGRFDLLAQGRQLGRGQQTAKAAAVLRFLDELRRSDPAGAEKYAEIIDANRNGINRLTGNRHFPDSDYMVHRRPGWYASVRMNSVRTAPAEDYINRDNALGRYLSDGTMLLMKSGDEYRDIAGCWDWTRLPGTTLPATPVLDEAQCRKLGIQSTGGYPYRTLSRERRYRGESFFTGGVSDGERGAAVYTMELDGVKAKKACFFDRNAIFALGCGIDSESPYPVATTVESRLKKGETKCGDGWFWHDGTGYIGQHLADRSGFRDGDWRCISGGIKTPAPDRKELFTLVIDHGTRCRGAKYEYIILPEATPGETAAWKGGKILSNTPELQAVEFEDGTRAAVFHTPGLLGTFRADRPGLYLIGPGGVHFAAPPAVERGRTALPGTTSEPVR